MCMCGFGWALPMDVNLEGDDDQDPRGNEVRIIALKASGVRKPSTHITAVSFL